MLRDRYIIEIYIVMRILANSQPSFGRDELRTLLFRVFTSEDPKEELPSESLPAYYNMIEELIGNEQEQSK